MGIAVLWSPDGQLRYLDPQGVGFSPTATDARGAVVGGILGEDGFRAAVSDHRGVRRLYTLDARDSNAWAVNGPGVVVGIAEYRTRRDVLHPIAWVADVPVRLGDRMPQRPGEAAVDPADTWGVASDVNDSYVVVGTLGATAERANRAVLWRLVPGG